MRVYDAFQAAFDAMPLVHVLSSGDRKVFVVHGGMMQRPGVTLAHIAAIKRKREIPYGLPSFEDKLFEDLMWRCVQRKPFFVIASASETRHSLVPFPQRPAKHPLDYRIGWC
jgi:hypothetical protein